MDDPQPPISVLSYNSPPIYLTARHCYRGAGTLVSSLILFLAAGGFVVAAWRMPGFADSLDFSLRAALCVIAVPLLLYGVVLVRGYITRRIDTVLITRDGIVEGPRIWQWTDIRRVEGHLNDRSEVTLHFMTGGRVVWSPHSLLMTPALTPEQYTELARVLAREVEPLYPRLTIVREAAVYDG